MSWKDDVWKVGLTAKPGFTYDDMKNAEEYIRKQLKGKLVGLNISTLGGKERASIILSISLDKEKDWLNGIYENSRYRRFMIDHLGAVENFSLSYKLKKVRKKNAKSIHDAIDYIIEKM